MGLCFRCEHRAKYLELLHAHDYAFGPRCECKDPTYSAYSCYMFKPCKPVVTAPTNANDERPRFAGAMLSSREEFVRILDEAELDIIYHEGNEVALGWVIKDES